MSCNRRPTKPLTAKLRQPPHCDPVIDPDSVPLEVLRGWANQRLLALGQPTVPAMQFLRDGDVENGSRNAYAAWNTIARLGLYENWYALAMECRDCLLTLQRRLRDERAERAGT